MQWNSFLLYPPHLYPRKCRLLDFDWYCPYTGADLVDLNWNCSLTPLYPRNVELSPWAQVGPAPNPRVGPGPKCIFAASVISMIFYTC